MKQWLLLLSAEKWAGLGGITKTARHGLLISYWKCLKRKARKQIEKLRNQKFRIANNETSFTGTASIANRAFEIMGRMTAFRTR